METSKRSSRQPNPVALAAVHERILYFLAMREMEQRAKKLKARKPAAKSISA